jgi:3-isopropylmalate/(R)-2-methylmalate dehydratase small subunit
MKLKGKVFKFGNHIDTDVIIPARYLNISEVKELAKHCMEDTNKDFVKKVKKGDMIVAGENFGCGSSREHAPLAIKHAGISAVVAKSFARIFYRNAVNIGLPILECPQAVKNTKVGDNLEIDLEKGVIKNLTNKKEFKTQPFPKFIMKIIKSGGLMNYLRKEQNG